MGKDKDESKPQPGNPSTQAPPKKAPARPRRRNLPRFKVLLHNDDHNTMEYVVRVIQKLTPLSKEEAILRMREAHETGVSLLLVTHKERAELYVEQFASCGLTTTIEPE